MKTLMILSHPDDEILFGYPIIQNNKDEVYLLTLSDNHGKYGDGPKKALAEVCKANEVNLIDCFNIDTGFSRLPTRYESFTLPMVIEKYREKITQLILDLKPDSIFTHNPMGEYGHSDHRFTFNLVTEFNYPMLFTDICFLNKCHLSTKETPNFWMRVMYDSKKEYNLDIDWYENMKDIYEKHKAWSWSGHNPIEHCWVYQF
jgi:hypothetical protein